MRAEKEVTIENQLVSELQTAFSTSGSESALRNAVNQSLQRKDGGAVYFGPMQADDVLQELRKPYSLTGNQFKAVVALQFYFKVEHDREIQQQLMTYLQTINLEKNILAYEKYIKELEREERESPSGVLDRETKAQMEALQKQIALQRELLKLLQDQQQLQTRIIEKIAQYQGLLLKRDELAKDIETHHGEEVHEAHDEIDQILEEFHQDESVDSELKEHARELLAQHKAHKEKPTVDKAVHQKHVMDKFHDLLHEHKDKHKHALVVKRVVEHKDKHARLHDKVSLVEENDRQIMDIRAKLEEEMKLQQQQAEVIQEKMGKQSNFTMNLNSPLVTKVEEVAGSAKKMAAQLKEYRSSAHDVEPAVGRKIDPVEPPESLVDVDADVRHQIEQAVDTALDSLQLKDDKDLHDEIFQILMDNTPSEDNYASALMELRDELDGSNEELDINKLIDELGSSLNRDSFQKTL